MKVTLTKLEQLQATTPIPQQQRAYSGCLTDQERQIMADIYKSAGLRAVRVNKRTMNKYRKIFE